MKVLASAAPVEVTVNGIQVGYEYQDEGLEFVIDVPVNDCAAQKVVKIR